MKLKIKPQNEVSSVLPKLLGNRVTTPKKREKKGRQDSMYSGDYSMLTEAKKLQRLATD